MSQSESEYTFFIDKTGNEDSLDDEVSAQFDEEDKICIQLDPFPRKQPTARDDTEGHSLTNTYFGNKYKPPDHIAKLLEKSVLTCGYEKLHAMPMLDDSKRARRKQNKIIQEKSKGKNWFHLPATTVTEDIKNDLEVLKMRSVLDPKHVYKKNDITVTPKYFQVGRVIESAAEFYSSRIPKSQRKRTIVDELLADSECRAYQKKKYKEIVDDNRRRKRDKAFSRAKKLKKKNK